MRSFCWALDLRRLATRSALLAHGGFDGGLKQGTNCSNNPFRWFVKLNTLSLISWLDFNNSQLVWVSAIVNSSNFVRIKFKSLRSGDSEDDKFCCGTMKLVSRAGWYGSGSTMDSKLRSNGFNCSTVWSSAKFKCDDVVHWRFTLAFITKLASPRLRHLYRWMLVWHLLPLWWAFDLIVPCAVRTICCCLLYADNDMIMIIKYD